jgi:hypothetical protein
MIPVHFNKSYAEQVFAALRGGRPIPPPEGGWSQDGQLMVAGVLYAGVFSYGPAPHQSAGLSADQVRALRPGRPGAAGDTFRQDILDGIEFAGVLARKVLDGGYDAQCGPEVKAVVYRQEDGGQAFVPVEGFKER